MTNQSQITICQTSDNPMIGYSDAELKRMGKQLFCATCQRWQFKRRRCKLFVEGFQPLPRIKVYCNKSNLKPLQYIHYSTI